MLKSAIRDRCGGPRGQSSFDAELVVLDLEPADGLKPKASPAQRGRALIGIQHLPWLVRGRAAETMPGSVYFAAVARIGEADLPASAPALDPFARRRRDRLGGRRFRKGDGRVADGQWSDRRDREPRPHGRDPRAPVPPRSE